MGGKWAANGRQMDGIAWGVVSCFKFLSVLHVLLSIVYKKLVKNIENKTSKH